MSRMTLAIDNEFAGLCPRQVDEEVDYLTEALRRDGCRDPIVYWEIRDKPPEEWPIVDGMTRYKICRDHSIDYETKGLHFKSRAHAIAWIILNQLGRRNVSSIQKSSLRARYYEERKAIEAAKGSRLPKPPGSTVLPEAVSPEATSELRQSELAVSPPGKPHDRRNLAAEVAKETGTTEGQIHRDVKAVAALEKLSERSAVLADAARTERIAKKDIPILAEAPEEVVRSLEKLPDNELRAAAREAAKAIREHQAKPRKHGPIVPIKALADFEKSVGKLVRMKSDCLEKTKEACGGAKANWANKFESQIRGLLNQVFDLIVDWKKAAEAAQQQRRVA
jgi:hypothetical protein